MDSTQWSGVTAALGMIIAWLAGPAQGSEGELLLRGEAIYESACVSCHGPSGQGVTGKYDDPLVGDATIGELASLISDTMPEEAPESCVADDAFAVATYIHQEFYSAAARLRNRPPRVELMRLTGEQLRQSLADLYGHFFDSSWVEPVGGIQGFYFQGNRWRDEARKIKRVDAVIDFDFGKEGPGEGIDPEEYYIHWSGSLKVDRTGVYEIILHSTCSCTLMFGHSSRELVNNHVQSEGREEFRRLLHLTGGRAYRLELAFTQRKRKTEQPPARVSLSWIPPGGQQEIIPARHLIPSAFPPTFALQTKLPADDRSYGYDRGIDINRQWDDSTTDAAIEFAQVAIDELWPRYQSQHRKRNLPGRELLRQFLTELASIAMRGPLDERQQSIYIDQNLKREEDDAAAIERSVLMALKSPRFLYPRLDADRSRSQRVANRLALTLYDSLPSDPWLIALVEKNQLQTSKQVRAAAQRMSNDFRLRTKGQALINQWLDAAHWEEITKDQELYPGFDRHLVGDLRKSWDEFIEAVVWSDASDFRDLLSGDWTYTTDRLAEFYGASWQAADDSGAAGDSGAAVQRSVSDSQRRGILTHPLLLSQHAYHQVSSPIHRGVMLVRHVLGRTLRPPNEAFSPLDPNLHPDLTTRQRVELQTNEVNCQVCHEKINSLGFSLENYDAVGRFRDQEKNHEIDATGHYIDRSGTRIAFEGAVGLADYLVESRDCRQAFVEAAFEHLTKQSIAAFGRDLAEELTDRFVKNECSIRQLLIEIAVIVAENEWDGDPANVRNIP